MYNTKRTSDFCDCRSQAGKSISVIKSNVWPDVAPFPNTHISSRISAIATTQPDSGWDTCRPRFPMATPLCSLRNSVVSSVCNWRLCIQVVNMYELSQFLKISPACIVKQLLCLTFVISPVVCKVFEHCILDRYGGFFLLQVTTRAVFKRNRAAQMQFIL